MSFKYDDKAKKTFCPLAWNHSFVNQDGSFQVCCTSEEFDNFIRDEKNNPIYITDGKSADEVMNTEFMKKLRLKMLNGQWPELCRRCLLTEKMGSHSRRNVEINNYEGQIEELIASTHEDGSIEKKVTSADYRLGNLCNLQCRMCNPRSTKLWIKEWNDMKPEPEKFSQTVMESYTKYDWIDSEHLVKDFEYKAANLEHIHFAGGEPLLVPQMAKMLQKCIDSGNAKNIVLTYNTNLTLLPAKVLELWKHFKGVKILASVDAIGELNYYIRYPANWEQINKNLHFIDEHHEEYNITECILSTTVQALNVHHLPKIYEYLSQFKFIIKAPNLINLYFPMYFQTTVLPPLYKKLVHLDLLAIAGNIKKDLQPQYHYLADNLDGVIQFMNSQNGFENGDFEKFKDFQKKFDQKKNLNLLDYCPDLKPFLSLVPPGKPAQDK